MTTTTGSRPTGQPVEIPDGRYQVRIESYDPARNTMKAIWLVSRNQRLLSQLLDKYEVSNSKTSDAALRGSLLSVQRELQELREAMDHHDGAQTPILDTAELGMDSALENWDLGEDVFRGALPDPPPQTSERPSSAFGFGASQRRRSVLALSRIPRYSRPSIRTDFCVSTVEAFPWIRALPSKIPRPPAPPKKKKTKKIKTCGAIRPKTSLSMSRSADQGACGKSILKTSALSKRPATSMALTKRVSFGDPVVDKRVANRPKTKGKKKTQCATKTQPVRAATSLGVRGIPRSSSRCGRRSGRLSAADAPKRSVKSVTSVTSKPLRTREPVKKDATPAKPTKKKSPAKAKLPVRPKSAMEPRRPDVLPYESPPPAPKLLSQPLSDESGETSPLIRSVSIIDDEEIEAPFDDVQGTLPRIRVGEQAEYQVKAFFLDEIEDLQPVTQLDSGVIPSSPVEVDASICKEPVDGQSRSTRVEAEKTRVQDPVLEKASVEAPRRDPIHDTASFPELGMDFLPEFESEVNGLLDTLLSQDLLTSSLTQDLRLFSTESNFIDTLANCNERSQARSDAEENEMPLETEANDVKVSQEIMDAGTAPAIQNEEATNKDHTENSDVACHDVMGRQSQERTESKTCFSEEMTEVPSVHHASASADADLMREAEEEDFSPIRMPFGDGLRRKSTGSHDVTAPIAAAVQHRRSQSQNELDAIMTHNDGRSPSPGFEATDKQPWEVESSAMDPYIAAETCSLLSSSELTLPDPTETYHDVHHGYSPSFAMAADPAAGETPRRRRQMAAISCPQKQQQASFAFYDGGREDMCSEGASVISKEPSDPTLLRSESSGKVLSTTGGELLEDGETLDVDPIEIKNRRCFQSTDLFSTWGEYCGSKGRDPVATTQTSEEARSTIHATDQTTMECVGEVESSSGSFVVHSVTLPLDVPTNKETKKWSKKSCGFFRFLSCRSSIEKTDM